MKKIIIILAAAIVATTAISAQKLNVRKVDFKHVKEVIQNPNSQYFYPKLLEEFQKNDTTMSLESYRNLYYGYTFQEDYDPYRVSTYCDRVEELYTQKEFTRDDNDSIEHYAELSLKDNLFDLEQREFFTIALLEKKKFARATVSRFKLDCLIRTILESGKGTEEEPWVVIYPDHEYNIINYLGYVAKDHKPMDNGIEFIEVQPKEGKSTKGFYFDVSRILEVERVKYPE